MKEEEFSKRVDALRLMIGEHRIVESNGKVWTAALLSILLRIIEQQEDPKRLLNDLVDTMQKSVNGELG